MDEAGSFHFRQDFELLLSCQDEAWNFAVAVYSRVCSFFMKFIKAAFCKAFDMQMKRI